MFLKVKKGRSNIIYKTDASKIECTSLKKMVQGSGFRVKLLFLCDLCAPNDNGIFDLCGVFKRT